MRISSLIGFAVMFPGFASAARRGTNSGRLTVSPDSTCGGSRGYSCESSYTGESNNAGSCCSRYGWCQPEFGDCWGIEPPVAPYANHRVVPSKRASASKVSSKLASIKAVKASYAVPRPNSKGKSKASPVKPSAAPRSSSTAVSKNSVVKSSKLASASKTSFSRSVRPSLLKSARPGPSKSVASSKVSLYPISASASVSVETSSSAYASESAYSSNSEPSSSLVSASEAASSSDAASSAIDISSSDIPSSSDVTSSSAVVSSSVLASSSDVASSSIVVSSSEDVSSSAAPSSSAPSPSSICVPTTFPTGPSLVVNGGFETANHAGWLPGAGTATYQDSTNGPDTQARFVVLNAIYTGTSSSVRAELLQVIDTEIPAGHFVSCSFAYKTLAANADYIVAQMSINGLNCGEGFGLGGWYHSSGGFVWPGGVAVIKLEYWTDATLENISAGFDSVVVKVTPPPIVCPA